MRGHRAIRSFGDNGSLACATLQEKTSDVMKPLSDVSPTPIAHDRSAEVRQRVATTANVSRRVMFGFLLAALAAVLIGITTYWASTQRASAVSRLANAQQSRRSITHCPN